MLYSRLFYLAFCLWLAASFIGFYQSGSILLLSVLGLNILVWVFLRKKVPSFCFSLSVILLVSGLIQSADPLYMIAACGFIFAAWDLTLAELKISENREQGKDGLYGRLRVNALGTSLLVSYALIYGSGFVKIRLPFFVVFVLAILAFCVLFRFLGIVREKTDD